MLYWEIGLRSFTCGHFLQYCQSNAVLYSIQAFCNFVIVMLVVDISTLFFELATNICFPANTLSKISRYSVTFRNLIKFFLDMFSTLQLIVIGSIFMEIYSEPIVITILFYRLEISGLTWILIYHTSHFHNYYITFDRPVYVQLT